MAFLLKESPKKKQDKDDDVKSTLGGGWPFDGKSPGNVALYCRRYLSFKDICATRAVSTNWNVISSIPIQHTIFISEDSSFAGLPNFDNKNFRACLLAADLRDVNIEISTAQHLNFLHMLLPSIRRLSMEIEMPQYYHDRVQWTRGMFNDAKNLAKLDVQVYGLDNVPIDIDFKQMPNLTHINSNVQLRLLNYDQRRLGFLGYVVDYWDELCTWIAFHCTKIQVCRYETKSPAWEAFVRDWRVLPKERIMPLYIDLTASGTLFATCVKGLQTCVLYPAMHLDQFENIYEGSYADYKCLFTYTLQQNPSAQFLFHESCTDQEKIAWKRIMDPIRANLGLPELSLP